MLGRNEAGWFVIVFFAFMGGMFVASADRCGKAYGQGVVQTSAAAPPPTPATILCLITPAGEECFVVVDPSPVQSIVPMDGGGCRLVDRSWMTIAVCAAPPRQVAEALARGTGRVIGPRIGTAPPVAAP